MVNKAVLFSMILVVLSLLFTSCGGTGKASETPVADGQDISLPANTPATTHTTKANTTQENQTASADNATASTETTFAKRSRFTAKQAYEKAYNYGADNVLFFAFGSTMGSPFDLKDNDLIDILKSSGLDSEPWKHQHLLERVYHSGVPTLSSDPSLPYATDYANWRWDVTTFDQQTTVKDMANTIIAELTLATALDGTGTATDAYTSSMLSEAASKQALFMAYKGKAVEGMYADFKDDGSQDKDAIDLASQFDMLFAYSFFSSFAKGNKNYNGEMKGKGALGYANQMFNVLAEQQKKKNDSFTDALDPVDYVVAIQGLGMFISITEKPKWEMMAEDMLTTFADKLRDKMDAQGNLPAEKHSQLLTQASGVVALGYAYSVSQTDAYADDAKTMFRELQAMWDDKAGAFKNGNGYDMTAQELAMVTEAYNVAVNQLKLKEDDHFAGFFRNEVTGAGFQQAELEEDDDEVQTPAKAHVAPVLGNKIAFNSVTGTWKLEDPAFVTTDALTAATAFMRIGLINGVEAVPYNGFPQGLSISG